MHKKEAPAGPGLITRGARLVAATRAITEQVRDTAPMNHDIIALVNSVENAFETSSGLRGKCGFKMTVPWSVYLAVLEEIGRRKKPSSKPH